AGVDAAGSRAGGAQYLRTLFQPRPDPAVLAMASDPDPSKGCAGAAGTIPAMDPVRPGVVAGTSLDLPDQPLRPVRIAPGMESPAQTRPDAARIQGAVPVQARQASALRRLHRRVVVHPDDDGRPLRVRARGHRLHPRRGPLRGAGPQAHASRVRRVQPPGTDADTRAGAQEGIEQAV